MRLLILFSLAFIFSTGGFPQSVNPLLKSYEDSLRTVARQVQESHTLSERHSSNRELMRLFASALTAENSFAYPFDSLKTIAKVVSADSRFRIFTWALPHGDGTYEFSGIIQQYDRKSKKSTTAVLHDRTETIINPNHSIAGNDNWYGALYYSIMLNRRKGKRYYTLLGWKGHSLKSTKKVIEVMWFAKDPSNNNQMIRFGAPLFHSKQDTTARRIIFEYNASVSMSLRWDIAKKRIVFDHLSPDRPQNEGKYEFYGPDFSYDALKFKKGRWTLIEDVDVSNQPHDPKKKLEKPEAEKGLLPGKGK